MTTKNIVEYWNNSTPMKFDDERWSYEKKRGFRYGLQDYMHSSFQFDKWKDKSVLEIGCGSGIDAMEFARNGALVTATDITENAVRLTMEMAKEAGFDIQVVKVPANGLPFQNSSFDCCYSFGVLHHIPNISAVMDEIYRVLKPGGQFMGMVYNRDSLLFAYSIFYLHYRDGTDLDELASMYSERNIGCPYTKCYTKDEAKDFFGQWFQNVTVEVKYNTIDTQEQRKVKLGLDDKWELGWHIIVKGIK